MLITSPKQALPPGGFITKPLYHEDILTLATAPGMKLLVIICFRAATMRTGGAYFPRCLFIKPLPVFITPLRSDRHYILLITGVILSHRRPGGRGLFLPLARRVFPSPTPGHILAWTGNLCGHRRRHRPVCFPA